MLRPPFITRLAILALLLGGSSVLSVDPTPPLPPPTAETVEGRGAAKIVLMDVSGMLSAEGPTPIINIGTPPARVPMLVRIREELKKAESDGQVRALIVRINSPGGTVTASDIIYRELDAFRTATGVPIVASMMDVAASGGYYIALAADTIVAHPTTVTGSIGVVMISLNAEGLMQKVGLATSTIKSGERKDMGSPFRALTPEERAIFQSVIDELQRQFVAKVVGRRKIAPTTADRLADGRIYTAPQALSLRLVDAIGYMPDAPAAYEDLTQGLDAYLRSRQRRVPGRDEPRQDPDPGGHPGLGHLTTDTPSASGTPPPPASAPPAPVAGGRPPARENGPSA